MTDHNHDVLVKVIRWLGYAEDDLRLAKNTLKTMGDKCPYHLVAYHAQQSAEKCLKAFLVFHNIDFPYTHDISRLLELCAQKATWAQDIQNAEELTLYAISARYPEEIEEVTVGDAHRAIEIAEEVRKIIHKVFSDKDIEIPPEI
ncbi:HEPN domain-containing protein [Candidatus Poribacteria bacterium]|nr:HEPN domain-containing protein [Candidatus Poribacteria bacterium]